MTPRLNEEQNCRCYADNTTQNCVKLCERDFSEHHNGSLALAL